MLYWQHHPPSTELSLQIRVIALYASSSKRGRGHLLLLLMWWALLAKWNWARLTLPAYEREFSSVSSNVKFCQQPLLAVIIKDEQTNKNTIRVVQSLKHADTSFHRSLSSQSVAGQDENMRILIVCRYKGLEMANSTVPAIWTEVWVYPFPRGHHLLSHVSKYCFNFSNCWFNLSGPSPEQTSPFPRPNSRLVYESNRTLGQQAATNILSTKGGKSFFYCFSF